MEARSRTVPRRTGGVAAVGVALTCSAAVLVGSMAHAQRGEPEIAAPSAADLAERRDPRVPASTPNISGVWFTRGYQRRIRPMDGSETPWLPWTKAAFDRREAAEKAGAPLFDPTASCLPSGIPRLIAAPYPIEIVQTPDTTVILYETHHLFRLIHMDQPHPRAVKPSFMGHSTGRWEGDTLVVDTVGLTPLTQIDEAGTLHSDALHVVERIRKTGPKTLEDVFTIDDPKAFARPWTAKREFDWRPDVRLMEYVCEENNRNAPGASGVLKNF